MHPDWQNQIHVYCENYSSSEPEVLQKLTQYTWRKTVNPRQLSVHLQGRFLAHMVHLLQPLKILEIGTFTGYATYCLAQNALPNTEITTIEADAEIAYKGQQFWKNEAIFPKINWRVGNAIEIMGEFENIDLMFIDADKHNYQNYFELGLKCLSNRGVMLFDNTLWSGKVVSHETDKDTQKMHEFNTYVAQHPEVMVTLLPIRDGLTWVSKKPNSLF